MGYSGYEQVLCANGHYFTYDCYVWDYYGGLCDEWQCPYCGTEIAWVNSVDTTNEGYVNEDGSVEPAYGYVPLKLLSVDICKECGHPKEVRYQIPTEEETHWAREKTYEV